MEREDISKEIKVEFTEKVNQQKGRKSCGEVRGSQYLKNSQETSWNENGYILVPQFCSEEYCGSINDEVVSTIRSLVDPSMPFSHAYTGQGHIAIREMKSNPNAENIEDEISKLFRIHSSGLINDLINREDLLNLLEDIIGPNIDCFLSQFIFKNPGAWGQPWHQDSSYFPFDRGPQVGVWLATSPATLKNGCLVVLPNSQKEELHEHLPDERKESNYGYTEIKDHDFRLEKPILMNTGDLLIFHSFLMHKSYDNKSNKKRTALTLHFAETGTGFGEHDSPTNEWISVRGSGLKEKE